MEKGIYIGLAVVVVLQLVLLFLQSRGRSDHRVRRLAEENVKSFLQLRQDLDGRDKNIREEINAGYQRMSETVTVQMTAIMTQLSEMMRGNSEQQERIRQTVDRGLREMQASNELKLDQIRRTVDEKMDETLSTRLDQSFQQVSERLESLYKSIGEMQSLATGVTDLNRVLNNQKVRGIWGEAQLENILMSVLTPDQYDKNVATKKGSPDRVEFAVRIPVADDGKSFIYLPIDSKNPASYEAIISASEENDVPALEAAKKELETRMKLEAKTIHDKYISTQTTDFAILFLPSEALYAEVIRLRGIAAYVQERYHIMLAGPTTLTALLSSISVGFRAVNISMKSKEVVKTLQAVKSQYHIFVELLGKSQKKLQEASNSVQSAIDRAGTIHRKLGKVDELDLSEAELLLELEDKETLER